MGWRKYKCLMPKYVSQKPDPPEKKARSYFDHFSRGKRSARAQSTENRNLGSAPGKTAIAPTIETSCSICSLKDITNASDFTIRIS